MFIHKIVIFICLILQASPKSSITAENIQGNHKSIGQDIDVNIARNEEAVIQANSLPSAILMEYESLPQFSQTLVAIPSKFHSRSPIDSDVAYNMDAVQDINSQARLQAKDESDFGSVDFDYDQTYLVHTVQNERQISRQSETFEAVNSTAVFTPLEVNRSPAASSMNQSTLTFLHQTRHVSDHVQTLPYDFYDHSRPLESHNNFPSRMQINFYARTPYSNLQVPLSAVHTQTFSSRSNVLIPQSYYQPISQQEVRRAALPISAGEMINSEFTEDTEELCMEFVPEFNQLDGDTKFCVCESSESDKLNCSLQ